MSHTQIELDQPLGESCKDSRDRRASFGGLVIALGIIAGLWVLFLVADTALPYIRPGADIIFGAKMERIRNGTLFRRDATVKVAIFGDSKALSGFRPDLFDSLSGGLVSSYNLGLPDYKLFYDNLATLCQRGEVPTHVLLTLPWSDKPDKRFTVFNPGIDDNRVMSSMFPFRSLPRNLFQFVIRARSHGGLRTYYHQGRRAIDEMEAQSGYYFIEGQSHFPGDRLPDNFTLQKDNGQEPSLRSVSVMVEEFGRLNALLRQYKIQAILVPTYYRQGEFAPAGSEAANIAKLAPYPNFIVRGPAYLLFANRYFSDPAHLNKEGAVIYTRMLWELVASALPATNSTHYTTPMPGTR
jgi:hypothetical protein